jgi:hypothetical protein
MKNFLPANSATTRRRRDVDDSEPASAQSVAADPAQTRVLPETAAEAPDDWYQGSDSAVGDGNSLIVGEPADGYPTAVNDGPALPEAGDEPFVPKPRYVMGRSTKILVCVLLVAAGVFAGSAVQKQIDARDRAARVGNFQGPGTGTGAGTGNSTTGQGRRNGGTGTGGAPAGGAGTGGAGSGTQPGAPAQGSGQ